MPLADTHCHLTSEEFENDMEDVLQRACENRLSRILVVGSDLYSSKKAIAMADREKCFPIYASAGIHPHDSGSFPDSLPGEITEYAAEKKVVAIGETGLDYYYDHSDRNVQKASFQRHIQLAREVQKPIIVHIRDAFRDSLDILGSSGAEAVGGVIHSFSGTWEEACEILDLGFFISFSGMLTFKKMVDLRNIASRLPLDRILCETDAPWLSPHPLRGRRNEPSHVRFVYQVLSECRKEDSNTVEKQVWKNAASLFGWE